jgi:hypothetical protein
MLRAGVVVAVSDPPAWWLRYHGLDDAGVARRQQGGGNVSGANDQGRRQEQNNIGTQPRRSGGSRGPSGKGGGPMVAVEGEVTGATEKALKFIVAESGEEVWFPKSQVRETETGLLIPQWLAQKNGVA